MRRWMTDKKATQFPSDVERNFFLGIYRSAVDFYKPRIEKRTGIPLGDIAVWDSLAIAEYLAEGVSSLRPRLIKHLPQARRRGSTYVRLLVLARNLSG